MLNLLKNESRDILEMRQRPNIPIFDM